MVDWREIRLWYANLTSLDALFDYKRSLVEVLGSHNVDQFMILAEEEYLLVRVMVEEDLLKTLVSALGGTLAPLFGRITLESWPPAEDARKRILSAKTAIQARTKIQGLPSGDSGWEVKKNDAGWYGIPADLETQVEAFTIFMTRVAGQFTRVYMKEMPSKIPNRWLMSVFLHLMLNSISFDLLEEKEIRQFPAW
jgi:hypothetical protein